MPKFLPMTLFMTAVAFSQVPKFTDAGEIKANGATISIGNSSPVVCDWNEDGNKDLFIGQFNQGKINYFENTGTDNSPVLKSPVFLKAAGADISVSSG